MSIVPTEPGWYIVRVEDVGEVAEWGPMVEAGARAGGQGGGQMNDDTTSPTDMTKFANEDDLDLLEKLLDACPFPAEEERAAIKRLRTAFDEDTLFVGIKCRWAQAIGREVDPCPPSTRALEVATAELRGHAARFLSAQRAQEMDL